MSKRHTKANKELDELQKAFDATAERIKKELERITQLTKQASR